MTTVDYMQVSKPEEKAGNTSGRTILVIVTCAAFLLVLVMRQVSLAGPLRDRIIKSRNSQEQSEMPEGSGSAGRPASLPSNVGIVRDVSYGSDEDQRFDAYIPAGVKDAPVIVMVHGGAWSLGDKAAKAVVENKVARWVPKGFILISANYRLLPKTDPLEQARDIARAVAAAQDKAASWGGDRSKFILMGHSAGAHLVSLLASAPALSSQLVSTPWLGTVALDSAALDIVKIMETKHARFYDRAFGKTSEYWKSASPFHAMSGAGQPILVVCSTKRKDSCSQADQFAAKASSLNTKASVLRQDLSHGEINQKLGEDEAYTKAVEAFLGSLNDSIAKLLTQYSNDKHH